MVQMGISKLERGIDTSLFVVWLSLTGLIALNAKHIPEYADKAGKMAKSCKTSCVQKYETAMNTFYESIGSLIYKK